MLVGVQLQHCQVLWTKPSPPPSGSRFAHPLDHLDSGVRAQDADSQLRKPVDEALHVAPTIDGAMLRAHHFDVELRGAVTPGISRLTRPHPSLVKPFGKTQLPIEVGDEELGLI